MSPETWVGREASPPMTQDSRLMTPNGNGRHPKVPAAPVVHQPTQLSEYSVQPVVQLLPPGAKAPM
jgi:hypothetical protein